MAVLDSTNQNKTHISFNSLVSQECISRSIATQAMRIANLPKSYSHLESSFVVVVAAVMIKNLNSCRALASEYFDSLVVAV